jgi:cryptochrome 1
MFLLIDTLNLLFDFQFEGYKCDPNGEYVRRWLPELARLPTEWIHHPWNAPESVLQAAGIELGSNYPLPIVEIDAATVRLEEALIQMWQLEAASRAAAENGTEEGLGDSSESAPIAFPQDIQMEERPEPVRNNPLHGTRRYQDQMVPSMTSSRVRVEEEETSSVRNSAGDSRAEVPTNANAQQNAREAVNQGVLQNGNRNTRQRHNNNNTTTTFWLRNAAEDSTAESSSSTRRERDGGVVPEWSPPSSNFSDQFVDDENGIGATSPYLQRHPQSHQLMSWTRLPQTG